jgi:hypothetical protein
MRAATEANVSLVLWKKTPLKGYYHEKNIFGRPIPNKVGIVEHAL